MPAQAHRLSDHQLKAVKAKDKDYVLSDGEGLQLRIRSNGSMLWNFYYRDPVTKKCINMGLGTYPELSLANARKKVIETRELSAQGIDPQVQRKADKKANRAQTEHTLENAATAWLESKKHCVIPAYAEDILRSLTLHVFPCLKTTPLVDITAPMIIKLLRPIEAKGSLETVKRLSQHLNEIMAYGVNCGLIFANPLSGIRAAFKKHQEVMHSSTLPGGVTRANGGNRQCKYQRITLCLIEWQLHKAARTSWAELDFDNRHKDVLSQRHDPNSVVLCAYFLLKAFLGLTMDERPLPISSFSKRRDPCT